MKQRCRRHLRSQLKLTALQEESFQCSEQVASLSDSSGLVNRLTKTQTKNAVHQRTMMLSPRRTTFKQRAYRYVPCLLKILIRAYWGDMHKYDRRSGHLQTVEAIDPEHPAIRLLHRLTERWFCVELDGTASAWLKWQKDHPAAGDADKQKYHHDAR
jgi:hypothetical protein